MAEAKAAGMAAMLKAAGGNMVRKSRVLSLDLCSS